MVDTIAPVIIMVTATGIHMEEVALVIPTITIMTITTMKRVTIITDTPMIMKKVTTISLNHTVMSAKKQMTKK
jgi:hypothetical protein